MFIDVLSRSGGLTRRYMAMLSPSVVLLATLPLVTACAVEPTQSNFCVMVSAHGSDQTASLVALLDTFSVDHELRRGQLSPNGITYAERENSYLLNVGSRGPLGAEISLYPRVAGSHLGEAAELNSFVLEVVGREFKVEPCESIEGYTKSVLYGYDGVAI